MVSGSETSAGLIKVNLRHVSDQLNNVRPKSKGFFEKQNDKKIFQNERFIMICSCFKHKILILHFK